MAAQILITSLVWSLRSVSWWLAAGRSFSSLRGRGLTRGSIVALGLLLNLGIDLILWGNYAPTLGSYEGRI